MAKKDVAKVPKGSKAKNKKKLSSWEKEYGDKMENTRVRQTGSDSYVHFDTASGKWLEGKGPETQVKKGRGGKRTAMKQGAKRKKAEGPQAQRQAYGGSLPPTRGQS